MLAGRGTVLTINGSGFGPAGSDDVKTVPGDWPP
jgi:hypothetical protein